VVSGHILKVLDKFNLLDCNNNNNNCNFGGAKRRGKNRIVTELQDSAKRNMIGAGYAVHISTKSAADCLPTNS
jgi:hypothetical protein